MHTKAQGTGTYENPLHVLSIFHIAEECPISDVLQAETPVTESGLRARYRFSPLTTARAAVLIQQAEILQ